MNDPTAAPEGAPLPRTPTFAMPTVERVRAFYHPLCVLARSHFGGSLGGRLLLVDGLEREGDALLIAASIAGAASLALELRPDAVRHCVRNGIVDFAVRTLEEALRVLKNEIRKQQPIVVLLQQEAAMALPAMVERGAQPDLMRWLDAAPAVATLRERGALAIPGPVEILEPTEQLPPTAQQVRWSAAEGGSAALRQLDQLALEILPVEDCERQDWIARAPRYLSRALRLERGVPMSSAETQAFLTAVDERCQQGTLTRPVAVTADGRTYLFNETAP